MDATLTFLGTGTSMGVPTLGCTCAVCTSADAHDMRLRPSVALRWANGEGERVVVIDTGPDFRQQALRAGLTHLDAVFYTHGHADHVLGMDDLRPFSFATYRGGGAPLPLYADAKTTAVLERIFDYTFSPEPPIRRAPRYNCCRSNRTIWCTAWILCTFLCCTGRWESPVIASAMRPISRM